MKSKPQVNSLRDIMKAETQAAAKHAAVKGAVGSQAAAQKGQMQTSKGPVVPRCSPRYWAGHVLQCCFWMFVVVMRYNYERGRHYPGFEVSHSI